MKKFLICILLGFICVSEIVAQNKDFSIAEFNLVTIYSRISRFESEEDNIKNNKIFSEMLDSVLRIPETFNYPFNDLKIGKVTAPDQTFRIFTWFMVHTNGTYEVFGYFQRYFKATNTVEVYPLIDKSATMKDPLMANCTPQNWYGATYYDIRMDKYDGITTYYLLGWVPNTTYTQKKVIETFRFDKKDKPSFGYQTVELKGKGFKKRVIFEYSAKQTMMLRYEKRKKMYVLDHLAAAEPRYEGIYEYYGPDFSIDGYKFRQGKLRYVSDIDLHSPRQKASDYIPEKIKQRRKKEVGTGI
ncbi:MAG: hypothetical protein II926_08690 [Bacteroidales bacterium]|nr:hypothetical protein [Bacteroidales bacterium]